MRPLLPGAALLTALLGAPAAGQWKLVWSDEFDGTSLDTSKWTAAIGNGCPSLCGWGNNEQQYYRAENATVAGGFLTIQAREEWFGGMPYTSARLHTENKGDFTYGRFEMRAKLPKGQGIWPAFWMFPTDEVHGTWAASGEIDIMELVGHEPNRVHGTTHFGSSWPGNTFSGSSYALSSGDFSDDFHVFALEWEPTEIRWYVDGIHYRTQTSWWSSGGPYPAPFDERFHLILNCAVGGNWPGYPDASTQFPQDFVVDWVRVYEEAEHDPDLCECLFDDMDHADPFGNGYFVFSQPPAGGGISAAFADVPPTGGGAASLDVGWGASGATGFYGGFGRTNPIDVAGFTHFELWIDPDAGQEYVIEVNLQDDDDGDGAIPGTPDGGDDEWQYELTVGPPGSGAEVTAGAGWQRVSIPLSSFYDDPTFHFGGNGVLDPSPPSAGGNGQLVNVVFALVGTSGSDITFRTDRWEFTRAAGAVSGKVWDDADGDGTDAGGESGLAGVTVELVDGGVVATDVTGVDGSYGFTGLGAGSYVVRVDPATVPGAAGPTFDPDGTGSAHEFAVTLACDQVLQDQDFGYLDDVVITGAPGQISAGSGGFLFFALKAPGQAGATFLVVGSLSGTQPGVPLGGGVHVPLNVDAYTMHTLANPNAPPFSNSLGVLDGTGQSVTTFSVGAGQLPPVVIGATMHHAYVTFDLVGGGIAAASNAAATQVTP